MTVGPVLKAPSPGSFSVPGRALQSLSCGLRDVERLNPPSTCIVLLAFLKSISFRRYTRPRPVRVTRRDPTARRLRSKVHETLPCRKPTARKPVERRRRAPTRHPSQAQRNRPERSRGSLGRAARQISRPQVRRSAWAKGQPQQNAKRQSCRDSEGSSSCPVVTAFLRVLLPTLQALPKRKPSRGEEAEP